MVDTIGKRIVALVSFFAVVYATFCLLGPASENQKITRSYFRADFNGTDTSQSELEKNYTAHTMPEFVTEVYKGTWLSKNENNLLKGMTSSVGLAYFHAKAKGNKEISDFKLYLFDGVWESDNIFNLTFKNAQYDSENKILKSDVCNIMPTEELFDNSRCKCSGEFKFTLNGEIFTLDGDVISENCDFHIKVSLNE